MRRGAGVAGRALTCVVLLVLLTGCSEDAADFIPVPGPGPAKVDVDTRELRALKKEVGLEDCASGPGGGALPAVTLPCLGGGTPVDLSTLRGPMLLSFWQAGCLPCEKEMPALQAFHEKHGDQVAVVGVDFLDLYPGSALEEAGERGVTYPSLADPGGDLQEHEEFAKVLGLPHLIFLDAQGRIVYDKIGGVETESELVELVDEHLEVRL